MTVALNDVVRATQEMTQPGIGAIQNVFHLQNQGVGVSDAQALSDVIEALEALAAIIAGIINVLQLVDGVRAINVTPIPPTDVGFGTFINPTPYIGAGFIMPTQVALGLNLHTARLSVSGRKFFGANVVGSFLNGGAVAAATLAIIVLGGNHLIAPFVATNSTWRYGVVASFDSAFLPFLSYSMPTMAIIQRRRRATVGI